jgi:hypothetical protein
VLDFQVLSQRDVPHRQLLVSQDHLRFVFETFRYFAFKRSLKFIFCPEAGQLIVFTDAVWVVDGVGF